MQALKDFIFTSESVSEGHPDKICDRISDTIVDAFLERDPYSRTAVETVVTTDYVGIFGEIRSSATLSSDEVDALIRQTVQNIGYDQNGFDWKTIGIENRLHAQSADIAIGVDAGADKDEGAGDQGIMFGYACDETVEFMPAPIYYSHKLLRELATDRKSGTLQGLLPDAKSQVTLEYRNKKPVGARAIVLSTQHHEDMHQDDIRGIVHDYASRILPDGWMCAEEELYVNPTGRFVIGGPVGDCGLTGRKIIVDTYGGSAPHGGGAFSGKDPTKVDRSAAYAARYLAKNVVAAGLAERCLIQLSYAIGVSKPISFYVDTQGTGRVDEGKIVSALKDMMDLSPRGIREHLQLNHPIYRRTSAYGHFGRSPDPDGGFSWEKTDLAAGLKTFLA